MRAFLLIAFAALASGDIVFETHTAHLAFNERVPFDKMCVDVSDDMESYVRFAIPEFRGEISSVDDFIVDKSTGETYGAHKFFFTLACSYDDDAFGPAAGAIDGVCESVGVPVGFLLIERLGHKESLFIARFYGANIAAYVRIACVSPAERGKGVLTGMMLDTILQLHNDDHIAVRTPAPAPTLAPPAGAQKAPDPVGGSPLASPAGTPKRLKVERDPRDAYRLYLHPLESRVSMYARLGFIQYFDYMVSPTYTEMLIRLRGRAPMTQTK